MVKLTPRSVFQFCCVQICLSVCSAFSIVITPLFHPFQHLLTLFTTSQFPS
jgi:hypothetical protein